MSLPRSKITAQGQISIPVDIRKKLGIGPGSVLEWHEEDEKIVVRRAARFSSQDIHRAIFSKPVQKARTTKDMKEGIRRRTRDRYARH